VFAQANPIVCMLSIGVKYGSMDKSRSEDIECRLVPSWAEPETTCAESETTRIIVLTQLLHLLLLRVLKQRLETMFVGLQRLCYQLLSLGKQLVVWRREWDITLKVLVHQKWALAIALLVRVEGEEEAGERRNGD
jgi:hypothetical protein